LLIFRFECEVYGRSEEYCPQSSVFQHHYSIAHLPYRDEVLGGSAVSL